MVDPSHSDLFDFIPAEATFSDPRRWPDAATRRFIPRDPGDLDTYDELYRQLYTRHFPQFVLCDEIGMVAPAKGSPRWVRTVYVQGRKRSIGHWGCHTRPREVDPNAIAQAQHVFVADLPNPDDRRRIAELADVPPDTLNGLLQQLQEFGFLWIKRRPPRQIVVCPPLR